jgi:hypothetical protein
MADLNPYLTAPIPGQSLTVEPGSVPWEQPPQYVTLDEVATFYSDKMNDVEAIHELMGLLKRNIPIVSIVNSMMKMGLMKGYHTVDTGFLVTPIIVEIIKTLADLNDVPYKMTAEEAAKENRVSPSIIKELIEEAKNKIEKNPEAIVERKGLMAKGAA